MELFQKAITMKLSHDGMYLVAKDDQKSVCIEREGSSKNAIWAVEFVNGSKKDKNYVRFKSCYGRYLTASNVLLREGSRERKVLQTLPTTNENESSACWEPLREDLFSWRFQTPFGTFLRRNWGLPPLWNPVTHDISRRMRMDKVLWDVEVVEAMPKPSFLYALPLPLSPNVKGQSLSSSNVDVPTSSSPPAVALSKFGEGMHQLAWPLPRPPNKI